MTDSAEITEAIARVEDAFDHGHGEPEFEPKLDAATDANEGRVVLQKGCRNLEAAADPLLEAGFYTSVIEHSFSGIERTIEGYLVIIAGNDPEGLRDHLTPYNRAKSQVPLERETIEAIESFYSANRTTYYYGTSVATRRQAESMLELADAIHEHIVGFDEVLDSACVCED
jgi:HEPN domain-containing protein